MIASVNKMAQIIDLFFESESALSNKQIAEMLNLPVSSVHHFLKTMCAENILMQDKDRKYRLGWRILEWSNKVMYQQEMSEKVAPIAANLVNRYKGSVHIGMFDNGQVRFIFKTGSGDYPEVTFKLAHITPPDHMWHKASEKFKEELETISGGTWLWWHAPGNE